MRHHLTNGCKLDIIYQLSIWIRYSTDIDWIYPACACDITASMMNSDGDDEGGASQIQEIEKKPAVTFR